MVANQKMLAEMGVSEENEKEINELHEYRDGIFKAMEEEEDHWKLRDLYSLFIDNERRLQELWGFPLDDNYIKFWEVPKCSCPKMDNRDNYPYGYYVTVQSCILHGGWVDEE